MLPSLCAVALAFVTFCPTVAAAQTLPTADAIRANNRSAVGTPPENERLVSSVVRAGVAGTRTYLRLGRDSRTDTQVGPVHEASGIAGGVTWRQTMNGLTVTGVAEPPEPSYEPLMTAVSRLTEPKELYVVSRLTARGRGTKAYFDPATWYEVRFERITPTGTVSTAYDDFRKTAGYVRPWHTVQTDGHPENDVETTVASDDAGVVDAAQLAIPEDRRTLVEFPAGKDTVRLPARLDAFSGKFIVRVKIGERGLDFVLDSGAAGIVLEKDVAQQLGLADVETYSSSVNAGRYVGSSARVARIDIGDLVMRDVFIDTTPELEDAHSDTKIVGLLGFDFLRGVGATLDYRDGTVTVTRPETFVAPSSPHTIALDVRLGHLVPQTAMIVNGAAGSRFTIDTGGFGAVMLTNGFRRLHPDAVVDENNVSKPYGLHGVGGRFPVDAITLKSIKLGDAEFDDVGAFVVKTDAYGADADGIIGPPVFFAYALEFDLAHAKVYLVPQP